MTRLDSALLDFVEWLCRRLQRWTGRSNVWLAFQLTNLSIVVYFAWGAGLYWVSSDPTVRAFIALFGGGVLFVLTRTIFRSPVEAAEAAAYQRSARGVRNPRRLRDVQLRLAFLTLSVVLGYPLWFLYRTVHLQLALLTDVLIVLTTVLLYVLACDPLPPAAGRLGVWWRGLVAARRLDAGADARRTAIGVTPERRGGGAAGSGASSGRTPTR